MREGTATLVRREDYAAPAFWIRSVELTFDLDPAKTIVASRLHIERNPPPRTASRCACTART
jgi:aminopeptidase N